MRSTSILAGTSLLLALFATADAACRSREPAPEAETRLVSDQPPPSVSGSPRVQPGQPLAEEGVPARFEADRVPCPSDQVDRLDAQFGTDLACRSYQHCRCVTDSLGRITLWERDDDSDGAADERLTFEYDEQGNLRVMLSDDGANDRVDWRQLYDEAGHLVVIEQDRDDDGQVDVVRTLHYDGNGYLLTEDEDQGADGVVDRRCTYEPCPPELECDRVCQDLQ